MFDVSNRQFNIQFERPARLSWHDLKNLQANKTAGSRDLLWGVDGRNSRFAQNTVLLDIAR